MSILMTIFLVILFLAAFGISWILGYKRGVRDGFDAWLKITDDFFKEWKNEISARNKGKDE